MGIEAALALSLGATAFGAYNAIAQGNAQQAQSKNDAAAAAANGRLEADQIRKQAKAAKGSAMAALAANGLDVNQGVSTVINDQITQDSESDAWMAILGGQSQSRRLTADGKNAALAGRNAATSTIINGASTAMSMGAGGGAGNRGGRTNENPVGQLWQCLATATEPPRCR
jgi:hypothetical protein